MSAKVTDDFEKEFYMIFDVDIFVTLADVQKMSNRIISTFDVMVPSHEITN